MDIIYKMMCRWRVILRGDLVKLNLDISKVPSSLYNTDKRVDLFHFLAVCSVSTELRRRWLNIILDKGEVIEW